MKASSSYKITVIIPAYQAEKTIARAISSVLNTSRSKDIELIVVDDCSGDNTVAVAKTFLAEHDNVHVFSLPENSGSPSTPRNFGIQKATGQYLTNLDADDWLDADRLLVMVDQAIEGNYDFVKGYLQVKEGDHINIANRLSAIPKPGQEAIQFMVEFQSMQDYIARNDFIKHNGFQYDSTLKIGEDTKLMTEMLSKTKKVAYIDNYYLTYSKTSLSMNELSSTQKLGDREVVDQITAWKSAQENLRTIEISFYELRLAQVLHHLLKNIVRYSDGISRNSLKALSGFINETRRFTEGRMNLAPRYKDLFEVICKGDYDQYCRVSRRRLLIAGYDLKFILPVLPHLEESFEIRIDEWTGHNTHNRKKSELLREWADFIWCEWMLGNAVYYSEKKNKHQWLVIRAHRFEIMREFGYQIDFSKVDAVFAVSYYFFEQFANAFSIPRKKMRLLSNYVDPSITNKPPSDESIFNIGIVGIVPSRKGFLKGLQLLKKLVDEDHRFKLHIFGKKPEEYDWIVNNPKEMDYFKACDQFISENDLTNHLLYEGYQSREHIYQNLGFVLSLSDNDPFPESFHLAPAEAAIAGCMVLILDWIGVEYIYPSGVIYDNLDNMVDEIFKASSDRSHFDSKVEEIRNFTSRNYSIKRFIADFEKYISEIRVLGK